MDLAKRLQNDIYRAFGVPATVGIGPNMLMSKLALDLEAKKATQGLRNGRIKTFKRNYGQCVHYRKCGA